MGQTLFDKVWKNMCFMEKKVNHNYYTLIYISFMKSLLLKHLKDLEYKIVNRRPDLTFATLDHNVPTIDIFNIKDEIAHKQITTLQQNAKDFGVHIFDMGSDEQGIVHMVGPETGLTQPGKLLYVEIHILLHMAHLVLSHLG